MQMMFRWYGEGNDRISLLDIKQIPVVKGIDGRLPSSRRNKGLRVFVGTEKAYSRAIDNRKWRHII